MRRLVGLTVGVLVACLVLAGLSAAGTVTVSAGNCSGTHQATVPAGSTVTIASGWGEFFPWLELYFLHVEKTTLSIGNGAPVNVSSLYGPIEASSTPYGEYFSSELYYPTGVTLATPGQTLTFAETITTSWLYPIIDNTGKLQRLVRPGGTLSSITCTVEAS